MERSADKEAKNVDLKDTVKEILKFVNKAMKILVLYIVVIEIFDLIAIYLAKTFQASDKILWAVLSAVCFAASGFSSISRSNIKRLQL